MSQKTSVLITGCSKGFGLLTSELLATDGHKVFATARDLKQAPDLLALKNKFQNLEVLELDVLNTEHISGAVKFISERENGKLDVLINNAGYGLMGRICDLNTQQVQHQFATNVFAPIEISKAFMPLLKETDAKGLIINISSIASYLGLPAFGAYSGTKAALNCISMSLACEHGNEGLSVVTIEPGPYKTEFRNSVRQAEGADLEAISKARKRLFQTQEDPKEIAVLINDLIQRKLNGNLGAYSEIPMGKRSNLFRVLSRWLPQEFFVKLMLKFAK